MSLRTRLLGILALGSTLGLCALFAGCLADGEAELQEQISALLPELNATIAEIGKSH